MSLYVRWIAASLVAGWAAWQSAGNTAPPQAKPDEHAGHDHGHAGHDHGHGHAHLSEKDLKLPRDFASAVARLKACRKSLGEELDARHYDAAHAALDEATIVVGKLMPLARDSGVPKSRWLEINLAGKDLKKRFGEVDSALHKTGRADLRAVAKPIDDSLRKLDAVAAEHGLARQAQKP